jgi:F420-0:gamma-glutamyl ligase-like protein
MTYDSVYRDWDYLFHTVGHASDMTGGYVDSEDLDRLLKNPSKATAKKCMSCQIDYWFQVGIEYNHEHKRKGVYDLLEEFPRIEEIAKRHLKDLEDCPLPFVIPT